MKNNISAGLRKSIAGLIICFLIYTTIYLGRQNLSIAAPLMERDGIADKVSIGIMGSMFFYIYAFGRLFNGWLGDLVNPKTMLLTGFTAAGLCNVFIGFMPSLTLMFILWGINGLVQSSMWGSVMAIVANLFEDAGLRKKAVMVLGFTIGIGGILTVLICTKASDLGTGWIFIIPGIIILVIDVFGFIILPNVKQKTQKEHINIFKLVIHKSVLRFIVPIIAQGIIKDNLNLWVPIFFTETYNINIKQAAIYIFVMPIATFMGKFMYPILFKMCRENEIAVAAVCYIISIIVLIPLAAAALPIYAAAASMFLVSAFIATANTTFSGLLPLRFFETGNIASMCGVVDFLTYMGSASGAVIFGFLVKSMGYSAMIWVWVGMAGLSALITLIFKKDYEVKQKTI